MPRLAFWNRIPDGSTLELSLNPSAGNFDVSADMLRDDGRKATFTHQQLGAGGGRVALVRPRIYRVAFTVRFLGAQNSTVTLDARVIKPGGGIHGKPFTEAISGNNGRVEEAAVLAVTRK
jgi:hypothetical protein